MESEDKNINNNESEVTEIKSCKRKNLNSPKKLDKKCKLSELKKNIIQAKNVNTPNKIENSVSKTEKGILQICCTYCDDLFYTNIEFKEHLKIKHFIDKKKEISYYFCLYCNMISENRSKMYTHILKLHPNPSTLEADLVSKVPNTCRICTKSYKLETDLNFHYKNVHSSYFNHNDYVKNAENKYQIKTYNCNFCQYECKNSITAIAKHLKSVHNLDSSGGGKNYYKMEGRRYYKCKFCNVEYDEYKTFIKHKKESHSSEIFNIKLVTELACKICSISFLTISELQDHVKGKHPVENIKKMKCEHCLESFVNLNQHKIVFPNGACLKHKTINKNTPSISNSKPINKIPDLKIAETKKYVKFDNSEFSCPFCDHDFVTKKKFLDHIENYHYKRNNCDSCKCNTCNLICSNLANHKLQFPNGSCIGLKETKSRKNSDNNSRNDTVKPSTSQNTTQFVPPYVQPTIIYQNLTPQNNMENLNSPNILSLTPNLLSTPRFILIPNPNYQDPSNDIGNISDHSNMILCNYCTDPTYFTKHELYVNHCKEFHENKTQTSVENYEEFQCKIEIEEHEVPQIKEEIEENLTEIEFVNIKTEIPD